MGKSARVILFSLLILAAFVSCCDESVSTYTVTFYPNGGTGEMQQQSFAAGQTASLKANAFIRDKYIFISWNTKADGSGTSYNDCALVTVSDDMTLYAQWAVRGVSITFDSNNGSGETSSQVVPLNTPATLRANTFQRENYGFVCWNTRADGSGTSYNDCALVTVSDDMTLYAQWGVLLTDDMEEWTESTYILNSDVTINYRVYIQNSDLRLILHDGYTLKADKGINVPFNSILTIDADGEGTGCVDAEAEDLSGHAAIGGNGTVPSGIIIINGGIIEADSDMGAGIGGGLGSICTSITINGGKVTARSDSGAGIGGGENSPGCPVTINGGTVLAYSIQSTGIGRGKDGSSDGTLEPGAGVRLYAGDNGISWVDYDGTRNHYMLAEKP